MDTVGEENERKRKEKVVFLTGGGEATNPENMGDLYAFVRSWCTEQDEDIHFLPWKGVDEYRDPVDPTS